VGVISAAQVRTWQARGDHPGAPGGAAAEPDDDEFDIIKPILIACVSTLSENKKLWLSLETFL